MNKKERENEELKKQNQMIKEANEDALKELTKTQNEKEDACQAKQDLEEQIRMLKIDLQELKDS